MEWLPASLYTITSTHHGDVHGVFVGVTVHYYIYSPWRRAWSVCRLHCTLLHLLTMATCMECLSASLYTITSTHHGDVHGVFVGVTVHYYIYSPWRRAWSACRRHCTLLHLLTMATCMECLSASLYTITSTHHGDVHGVPVGVTVHGHGLDAHLPRSTYDTTRDLPSVRDQDLLYRLDSCQYNTSVLTSLYLVTTVGKIHWRILRVAGPLADMCVKILSF